MIAYGRCPHCGLKFGNREEPVGQLYRCRKCKGVVFFAARNRLGETLFEARRDGPADLVTVPRV